MSTTAATSEAEAGTTVSSRGRALAAATIGNVLEWYDFAVYGYFAVTISKLFFTGQTELNALLLTVGTFGVGFVMRPVGAIVLGGYADRAGRKAGLTVTIVLMALGTAMIGLTPTYAKIGIFAPLLLVVARLLQGFSAGGELGSSTAFLVEHAPSDQRGRFASLQQASQGIALLLGSLVGAALTATLSQADLENWGWRVPFLLGLLIGPVGWYIRSKVDETEAFERRDRPTGQPIREALANYPKEVLTGLGVTIAWTVCTYCFLIYMPTYAIRELKLSPSDSLFANSLGLLVVCIFAPIFGAWSDRLGRRLPMIVATILMMIVTYPLFLWITSQPSFGTLATVQLIFGFLVAMYAGPAPALMSELFPTAIRSSGLSLGYNFAVTLFGGFAPFIATWLIATTGSKLSPTYYVIAANAVGFVILLAMRETARKPSA